MGTEFYARHLLRHRCDRLLQNHATNGGIFWRVLLHEKWRKLEVSSTLHFLDFLATGLLPNLLSDNLPQTVSLTQPIFKIVKGSLYVLHLIEFMGCHDPK